MRAVVVVIVIIVNIIVVVEFYQRILVGFPCISIFIFGFCLPTFVAVADVVVVAVVANRCFTFTFHSLHLTHFKWHINRGVASVSSWVVRKSARFTSLRNQTTT